MSLQRSIDAQAEKLAREYEILEIMQEQDETTPDLSKVLLMLTQSKRVQRQAGNLVKYLAQQRDRLQAQEATRQ